MKDEILTFSATGSIDSDPSQWVEGKMSTTGDPWLEQPALLFYTGRHKGKDWTDGDLAKMEQQFIPPKGELDWSVPGQLDHSESARDTTGHLRKVWRTAGGSQLWGTVRHVGKEAVQNAKNGLWRKLSLSVYGNSKRIREYSITPFPHLTAASTFSETTESESEESMAKANETETPNTPAPTPPAPTATQEPVNNFAEFKAQMEANFAARTAALEARLEKSEAENKELGAVVRFTQLSAEIDKFSEEGKTLPVMRETELALVQTFSQEQMELFRAYKAATPKLVNEEVLGDQDPETVAKFKESATGGESLQDKAKRMAAKYGHKVKETA